MRAPDERGRREPPPPVAMAALVEDARWRTSARGRRYLLANCSDASGQFMASCFDDDVSALVEEAAKHGGCGLLSVELDRKEGEETPRVTIRSIRAFEGMSIGTGGTRLAMEVVVEAPEAAMALAELLAGHRGGRGELWLRARLPCGGEARLIEGHDYLFDAELVAKVERMPGISAARLAPIPGPRLALVG
jgi:DNA polymerase-3 subunit alpha